MCFHIQFCWGGGHHPRVQSALAAVGGGTFQHGWVGGRAGGRVDGWVCGWVCSWVGGWVGGWVDGWVAAAGRGRGGGVNPCPDPVGTAGDRSTAEWRCVILYRCGSKSDDRPQHIDTVAPITS